MGCGLWVVALPHGWLSRILKSMEVHFTPETEKKLQDLAARSGSGTADKLVQDVVDGYFDELAQTREMLDSRYDDLKSGRVKPIPGDEVEAYFREKSAAARRSQQPGS
jgi:hypothetical protein